MSRFLVGALRSLFVVLHKATHSHFDSLSSPNKTIREKGFKRESEKEKIVNTQKIRSTKFKFSGGMLWKWFFEE